MLKILRDSHNYKLMQYEMDAGPGQGVFFAGKMITPTLVNGKGATAAEIGKSGCELLWKLKTLSGREQIERKLPFSKPTRQ